MIFLEKLRKKMILLTRFLASSFSPSAIFIETTSTDVYHLSKLQGCHIHPKQSRLRLFGACQNTHKNTNTSTAAAHIQTLHRFALYSILLFDWIFPFTISTFFVFTFTI